MSYDEVRAHDNEYTLGDGDVLENLLIDVSNGADVTITATGTNWTIRNIGIRGYYGADGPIIDCQDTATSGESLIENVYLADGASKDGSDETHGPGAIRVGGAGEHAGHIEFRHCNVQGFPNHGYHASAGPGSVLFRGCLAANNGVANFRCHEGGVLRDCVAYNDGTDYGWYHEQHDFIESSGRGLWVWPGSGSAVGVYNTDIDAGDRDAAIHGARSADATYHSGEMLGAVEGDITVASAVGDDPTHDAPAGVPTTPQQAASGTANNGGGTQPAGPPDVPDPSFHQYGVAYYSTTGRAQVTDSDFIWEGDGRPLWAADGAMGYASGRFDFNPEVDDDYVTDGGDDPGDVETDAEGGSPDGSTDAPESGDDVGEGSDDYSSTVDLRIHDVYVADIEEGPAIHIGADSDDATCIVENVHINGAEVGILADGATVEVRNCQISADERFATENGGEISESNVGSSPSMPGSVPASVDEAARGNAFNDL